MYDKLDVSFKTLENRFYLFCLDFFDDNISLDVLLELSTIFTKQNLVMLCESALVIILCSLFKKLLVKTKPFKYTINKELVFKTKLEVKGVLNKLRLFIYFYLVYKII